MAASLVACAGGGAAAPDGWDRLGLDGLPGELPAVSFAHPDDWEVDDEPQGDAEAVVEVFELDETGTLDRQISVRPVLGPAPLQLEDLAQLVLLEMGFAADGDLGDLEVGDEQPLEVAGADDALRLDLAYPSTVAETGEQRRIRNVYAWLRFGDGEALMLTYSGPEDGFDEDDLATFLGSIDVEG